MPIYEYPHCRYIRNFVDAWRDILEKGFGFVLDISLLPEEPLPVANKGHARTPVHSRSSDLPSSPPCAYVPFANSEVVFYVLLCGVGAVVVLGIIAGAVLNSFKRHIAASIVKPEVEASAKSMARKRHTSNQHRNRGEHDSSRVIAPREYWDYPRRTGAEDEYYRAAYYGYSGAGYSDRYHDPYGRCYDPCGRYYDEYGRCRDEYGRYYDGYRQYYGTYDSAAYDPRTWAFGYSRKEGQRNYLEMSQHGQTETAGSRERGHPGNTVSGSQSFPALDSSNPQLHLRDKSTSDNEGYFDARTKGGYGDLMHTDREKASKSNGEYRDCPLSRHDEELGYGRQHTSRERRLNDNTEESLHYDNERPESVAPGNQGSESETNSENELNPESSYNPKRVSPRRRTSPYEQHGDADRVSTTKRQFNARHKLSGRTKSAGDFDTSTSTRMAFGGKQYSDHRCQDKMLRDNADPPGVNRAIRRRTEAPGLNSVERLNCFKLQADSTRKVTSATRTVNDPNMAKRPFGARMSSRRDATRSSDWEADRDNDVMSGVNLSARPSHSHNLYDSDRQCKRKLSRSSTGNVNLTSSSIATQNNGGGSFNGSAQQNDDARKSGVPPASRRVRDQPSDVIDVADCFGERHATPIGEKCLQTNAPSQVRLHATQDELTETFPMLYAPGFRFENRDRSRTDSQLLDHGFVAPDMSSSLVNSSPTKITSCDVLLNLDRTNAALEIGNSFVDMNTVGQVTSDSQRTDGYHINRSDTIDDTAGSFHNIPTLSSTSSDFRRTIGSRLERCDNRTETRNPFTDVSTLSPLSLDARQMDRQTGTPMEIHSLCDDVSTIRRINSDVPRTDCPHLDTCDAQTERCAHFFGVHTLCEMCLSDVGNDAKMCVRSPNINAKKINSDVRRTDDYNLDQTDIAPEIRNPLLDTHTVTRDLDSQLADLLRTEPSSGHYCPANNPSIEPRWTDYSMSDRTNVSTQDHDLLVSSSATTQLNVDCRRTDGDLLGRSPFATMTTMNSESPQSYGIDADESHQVEFPSDMAGIYRDTNESRAKETPPHQCERAKRKLGTWRRRLTSTNADDVDAGSLNTSANNSCGIATPPGGSATLLIGAPCNILRHDTGCTGTTFKSTFKALIERFGKPRELACEDARKCYPIHTPLNCRVISGPVVSIGRKGRKTGVTTRCGR